MSQESKNPPTINVDALRTRLSAWTPPSADSRSSIGRGPGERFAAMLDVSLNDQATLPPLWVWFYFLEAWPLSDIGPDGHPVTAPFYPPLSPRVRMFAGGRVRVRRDIAFGEAIARRSEVCGVRVTSGHSGPLVFVTVRHTYSDASGAVVIDEEQDHVYRTVLPSIGPNAGGPTAETPASTEIAEAAEAAVAPSRALRWDRGRGQLDFHPDPLQLFLFSAITHNAHRIHYDLPYATAIERYPGLVVHGPLLALLMLELGRRTEELPFTGSFEYRLHRPAFAGQHLVVARSSDEVTVTRHGHPVPLATARFAAEETPHD
ncbi:MaoC family dehydratase N-terminal domain-containing protein [Nocardioides sp.]|uniref:FAS1-like dehydratase domain-containing protein n=1 Tax=Nocardioides sp. TaxID=35761 RepID=UPI003784B12B